MLEKKSQLGADNCPGITVFIKGITYFDSLKMLKNLFFLILFLWASPFLSMDPTMGERATPPKRYGMTDPVSLDGPTPADMESTAALEALLRDEFHLFESEEERQHREEVLGRLDQLAKEWVRTISINKVPHLPSSSSSFCRFLLRDTSRSSIHMFASIHPLPSSPIFKGLSEQMAAEAGAKIFTFGSYRLGVGGAGKSPNTNFLGRGASTRLTPLC